MKIMRCARYGHVFPPVVDSCGWEIAFDFPRRDALELAPIRGSERMFIRHVGGGYRCRQVNG
jgi:hypothetical protein